MKSGLRIFEWESRHSVQMTHCLHEATLLDIPAVKVHRVSPHVLVVESPLTRPVAGRYFFLVVWVAISLRPEM
jgi:hypothetical protein